jgi:2-polyprenyl-3-methyl-5-hydroxy-6-metoxy-1,4-benzoquinol methylase
MTPPSREMNSTQACPNCRPVSQQIVFVLPGARVAACRGCGLQFAERYPTYDEADSDIYGYPYFAPSIENTDHRETIFAELLGQVESVLKRKGRLLDIGAGEGTLLRVAAVRGWQVEGTEISSAMVRHARERSNLVVRHGAVEDVEWSPQSFDAVILNHVLEHVKNPRTTLATIRRILRPDGVVRIEVPNLASLSSRVKSTQSRLGLKRHPWKHYSTGHHFWFFTLATLRHTITTAGLTLISLDAPASQWGNAGPLDKAMNALYRKTAWGGHIVAYARAGDGGR